MNIRLTSQENDTLSYLLKILKVGYKKTEYSVHSNDFNCFSENNH